MSRSAPAKKAQVRLEDAAKAFAPLVKAAFELWLQTAEALPRHARDANTMTATHLVQTALQQAPWRTQHCDSKQVAWLKKHLPGTSTAMHACVSNHLDTSSKRISILKALVNSQQQQQDAHLSARMVSERKDHMLVEVLSLVVLLILPIAALCDDLASISKPLRNDQRSQRAHAQHYMQQAMLAMTMATPSLKQQQKVMREGQAQKGGIIDAFLESIPVDAKVSDYWEVMRADIEEEFPQVNRRSNVWRSVGDICLERTTVHGKVMSALLALQELGVPISTGPPELLGSIYRAQGLVAAAGVIWVGLLSQLGFSDAEAVRVWEHIECHIRECEGFFIGPSAGSYNRDALHKACIAGGRLGEIQPVRALPKDMKPVLRYFQHRAGAANAAAAAQQQGHRQIVGGTSPATLEQQFTLASQSSGDLQHQDAVPASIGSNSNSSHGVGTGSAAGSAQGDGDLNDMQALLRQMYGTTL